MGICEMQSNFININQTVIKLYLYFCLCHAGDKFLKNQIKEYPQDVTGKQTPTHFLNSARQKEKCMTKKKEKKTRQLFT